MTQIALIKLARLFHSQPLQHADWVPAEKTLFQRGALELVRATATKLLVNHDRDREVGAVLELVEFPDVDGAWLAARCRVDAPPDWLQQGKTAASFSYAKTQSQQIGDWTRILRGVLTEVSLLAPSVAPAESRAKVLVLREVPDAGKTLPAAVPKTSDRAAVGEVVLPAQRIVRHGSGEVLGVW